jgi:hypothetical protein
MNKALWSLALLSALALIPGFARAEKGFYIGAGFGLAVPYPSGDIVDDVNPGAGTSMELLHLGYNFTDQWGVGLQYGAAVGPTDDFLGDDTMWGQEYLDLSLRRTWDHEKSETYAELGYGTYLYMFQAKNAEFYSDPAVGYRLALGNNYFIGNWYLGPEVCYHWVRYSEGDFDVKHLGEFPSDFDTVGNMLLVQLKVGYHTGRKK